MLTERNTFDETRKDHEDTVWYRMEYVVKATRQCDIQDDNNVVKATRQGDIGCNMWLRSPDNVTWDAIYG